jgi:hypothetical protein
VVDTQLTQTGLEDLSVRRAEVVKRCAYDADPAGYVARGRTARADRRVGLPAAPGTMSVLTALLPVEQGVACLAALRARVDAVLAPGDGRSRDQIVADTLVERVTGRRAAGRRRSAAAPVRRGAGASDRGAGWWAVSGSVL